MALFSLWVLHPPVDAILQLIDGAWAASDWRARRVERHLEHCQACAEKADRFRNDISLLAEAGELWDPEPIGSGVEEILARAPQLPRPDDWASAQAVDREVRVFVGPGLAAEGRLDIEQLDLILVRFLGRRAARRVAQRHAAAA